VSNKDGESFREVPKTWADALGSIIKKQELISVLINNNYVDYVADPGSSFSHEANNLMDFMNSVGISHTTFTSFSEVSLEGTIIIPELEKGDLNPDLTNNIRSAIANFVDNGGKLVMFHPNSFGDLPVVLNAVFGFNLDTNGADEPINLTQAGAELFPQESNTIPSLSATSSINTATLPEGSVTIYEGDGSDQSVVTMIPYGSGKIYVLGWDLYDEVPRGENDGGWNHLLESILKS
jgi:hypothetical protein